MILAHGDSTVSPLTPHLHPDVIAFVVLVALAYWLALTRLGPRVLPDEERPCSGRQARLLVAAVATLWVFSDWPVHDLAEGYLYSVHMLQHSVYTLVLPPLFILGTPPGCGAGCSGPSWASFAGWCGHGWRLRCSAR